MFIVFLKMSIAKALDKQKKIEERIRAIQASIDAMQDNIDNNIIIRQRFNNQKKTCKKDCDAINKRIKELGKVIVASKKKLKASREALRKAEQELIKAKVAVVKASSKKKLKF